MKKRITVGFTMIYILLIIVIIEMIFDEDPNNDHFGSFLVMVMILVQAIHVMVRERAEGKKRAIRNNILFVVIVLGIVVWSGSKFIQ